MRLQQRRPSWLLGHLAVARAPWAKAERQDCKLIQTRCPPYATRCCKQLRTHRWHRSREHRNPQGEHGRQCRQPRRCPPPAWRWAPMNQTQTHEPAPAGGVRCCGSRQPPSLQRSLSRQRGRSNAASRRARIELFPSSRGYPGGLPRGFSPSRCNSERNRCATTGQAKWVAAWS